MSGPRSAGAIAAGTTTTIILVRHAEREQRFDPPLNASTPRGRGRLLWPIHKVLTDTLNCDGVTAIFCFGAILLFRGDSHRQTCDVLANRLGIAVQDGSQLELALARLSLTISSITC